MSVDLKRARLGMVIVDLQNDFLAPDGAYARGNTVSAEALQLPARMAPVAGGPHAPRGGGGGPPDEEGEEGEDRREVIAMFACQANEMLPTSPALPADLFTACLTTPIKTALRWCATLARARARA
ncbi:MAG: hypothetical protein ACK40L_17990, partial [Hydrogenophaga sp.]